MINIGPGFWYNKWDCQSKEAAFSKVLSKKTIENHAKVKQIQAQIRGWNIRKNVFLSHQIVPHLETQLGSFKKVSNLQIARIICLELNKMLSDPQKFKGKCIQLDPKKDLPFSLFVEMSKENKSIKCLIIYQKKFHDLGKRLDNGVYKKFYRAQEFEFSRILRSEQREAIHTPKVGIKIRRDYSDSEDEAEAVEKVKSGLEMHAEIIKNVQGYFAELPTCFMPSDNKIDRIFDFKQVWYNKSLHAASESNSIPIDFKQSTSSIQFTFRDKVRIHVDIARTLDAMHQQLYVHRDMKAANVIIRLDGNQIPFGYLNDFDFTQKMGTTTDSDFSDTKYAYWDALSRLGLVFPTTDMYGLVISLAECLLPMFVSHRFLLKMYKFAEDTTCMNELNCLTATDHFVTALASNKEAVLDPLRKDHNNSTSGELIKKIQDFLQTQGTNLKADDKNFLRRLEKELKVIGKIVKILGHVAKKNYELAEYLKKELSVYLKIYHLTLKNPGDAYQSVVKKLLFDPVEIKKSVEGLLTILDS